MKHRISTTVVGLALALVPAAAVAHGGTGHGSGKEVAPPVARAALAALRHDLRPLRDPSAAIAAGFVPSEECAELPGVGGMGHHYVHPGRLLQAPRLSEPAILVYVPTKNGRLTLGAVEWFQPDADQDPATDDDRPSLAGIPFDGPMPGHEPGMPVHYDLHAWLFQGNPLGLLSPWNPKVDC